MSIESVERITKLFIIMRKFREIFARHDSDGTTRLSVLIELSHNVQVCKQWEKHSQDVPTFLSAITDFLFPAEVAKVNG